MTIYVKEAVSEQPIQTLETVLVQLNGVERALVDIEDGEVKIEYDENQVSHESIKARIMQHGLHLLD